MTKFILLALLFGIRMSEQTDSGAPHATIYIYSGRPNPRWDFTIEEWSQLNQLIGKLPKIVDDGSGPYTFPGQLGYSGFAAHFLIVSSYPDIYYVAQSRQVVLSNPGGHMIYNDEQKSIETWFRDSAARHGVPLPI